MTVTNQFGITIICYYHNQSVLNESAPYPFVIAGGKQ